MSEIKNQREQSISQKFNNSMASMQWNLALVKGIIKGTYTYYVKGPDQPSWKLYPQILITSMRTMGEVDTKASMQQYRDYGNELAISKCSLTKNVKTTIPNEFREKAHQLVKSHLLPQLGDGIFQDAAHWSKSSPLEAEWVIPNSLEIDSNLPIFLYFHGGGFYEGRFSTYREPVGNIVAELKGLGFGLNYRLAPEFPFPCQLEDALASILYLTSSESENGFGSSLNNIVVGGDSSGGHLTSILFHFMRDMNLGQAAGGILWSPLLDSTHSQPSTKELVNSDFLDEFSFTPPDMRLNEHNSSCYKLTYSGSCDSVRKRMEEDGHYLCKIEHINHPLMSPLCDTNFSNLPPMLIQTGHAELLRDEAYLYANNVYNDILKSDNNQDTSRIQLQYYAEMPHAFMVVPGFTEDKRWMNETIKFFNSCIQLKANTKEESSPNKMECYMYKTDGTSEFYEPDFKFNPIQTWNPKN